MILSKENEKEVIKETIDTIKCGGVAILPTDTVYGLVADALNEEAIKRIYTLKRRSFSKPVNILVSDIDMIKKVTKNVAKEEEEIVEKYLPRSINYNI